MTIVSFTTGVCSILIALGQHSFAQTGLQPYLPDAPRPVPAALALQPDGRALPETFSQAPATPGFPPNNRPPEGNVPALPRSGQGIPWIQAHCVMNASSAAQARMSCAPQATPFDRFLKYRVDTSLSARQKFGLAWRDVSDPYNLLTVGGEAAYSIGTDSHSAYGPGFKGYGKYAGVSLAQDVSGEFLGTFLIPALARQDPRYYRMPNLPLRRRIRHVLDHVVVTRDDDGQSGFNYATVFGTIGTSTLANLYVPGRQTGIAASAARIAVALATDPIGNAITEFLPDVASHININVVLVQRVINRIAVVEGSTPAD